MALQEQTGPPLLRSNAGVDHFPQCEGLLHTCSFCLDHEPSLVHDLPVWVCPVPRSPQRLVPWAASCCLLHKRDYSNIYLWRVMWGWARPWKTILHLKSVVERDDPGLTVTDGPLSFWWIAPLCISLQNERRGMDEKNMQMCPWFDSTVMRLDLKVVR